jgi:hypothetical protein
MEPLYDLYYVFEKILRRVPDVNSQRAAMPTPKNQWIWPEIPTSIDDDYPRVTIQFLNLEESPVSAGGYVSDNLKSTDEIKRITYGKVYNVTVWIGLFVKSELKYSIARPDGQVILAKNALLGNLLFTEIIKQIDAAEAELRDVAYYYRPFEKTYDLNYEDSTKRIINSMTVNIPILAEKDIIFNPDQLIQTIIQNYTVNNQS